jgi:hypothetical protein
LTGVRAAALAGLAITPLPASALIAGLRILGVEEGLPLLPDLEFAIYEKARPDKAAAALAAVLLTLAQDHHARRSEMNRHFNRRESAVGQSRPCGDVRFWRKAAVRVMNGDGIERVKR